MQKELGLGDQDDSLVMMLQVTIIHAKWCGVCWFLFSTILTFSFSSNDRSPESRILIVFCLTWKQNTPKAVGNPKGLRSKKLQAHVMGDEMDLFVVCSFNKKLFLTMKTSKYNNGPYGTVTLLFCCDCFCYPLKTNKFLFTFCTAALYIFVQKKSMH